MDEKADKCGVRSLWLVGESLPLSKMGADRRATKTDQLDTGLVSLDPRHGVFPNLVMKPLFAATFAAFKESEWNAIALLKTFEAVVCDKPEKRFNLFQPRITDQDNPLSNRFVYNISELSGRVRNFDLNGDIWLVFGHRTIAGLLKWLLESEAETTRDNLKSFLIRFVKVAYTVAEERTNCSFSFPVERPSSGTARVGFLHRLCTERDEVQGGASLVLAKVVEKLNTSRQFDNEFIMRLLRCTVPLMHNEAYQDGSNPTGNAQAHFVKYAAKIPKGGDLYWQIMGHSVARRCFGRWVDEPN